MKKKFLPLILALACAASVFAMGTGAVFAESAEPEERAETVSVCGSGRISASPDAALICFGVETDCADLGPGQQENAGRAKQVLAALAAAGVPESSVTTEHYGSFPLCEKEGELRYRICHNFSFKTTELDRIEEFVGILTDAGANCFNGVRFLLENTSEVYKEALSAARADAIAKAAALQDGLKLVELCEMGVYWYSDAPMPREAGSGAALFAKGAVTVEANVRATFTA